MTDKQTLLLTTVIVANTATIDHGTVDGVNGQTFFPLVVF